MDIEPLWAIGGWSFLSNYCMAEPKASSSSSPISEPFSKSPSFLHFLSLFFILLLLINLSHQPHPYTTMGSSDKSTKSSESAMSTTSMHPQNTQKSHTPSSTKDAGREFGADAHEVPSGPNPISN